MGEKNSATQDRLAEALEVDVRTLRNYKQLANMLPELERIYGIRNGSANEKGDNRIGEPQFADDQMSQSDLANEKGDNRIAAGHFVHHQVAQTDLANELGIR